MAAALIGKPTVVVGDTQIRIEVDRLAVGRDGTVDVALVQGIDAAIERLDPRAVAGRATRLSLRRGGARGQEREHRQHPDRDNYRLTH